MTVGSSGKIEEHRYHTVKPEQQDYLRRRIIAAVERRSRHASRRQLTAMSAILAGVGAGDTERVETLTPAERGPRATIVVGKGAALPGRGSWSTIGQSSLSANRQPTG